MNVDFVYEFWQVFDQVLVILSKLIFFVDVWKTLWSYSYSSIYCKIITLNLQRPTFFFHQALIRIANSILDVLTIMNTIIKLSSSGSVLYLKQKKIKILSHTSKLVLQQRISNMWIFWDYLLSYRLVTILLRGTFWR